MMNNLGKHILIISLILTVLIGNVFAQEVKKNKTRIRVEYVKNHNKKETLVATLRVKEERYVPGVNSEIKFYCTYDTINTLLGKIRTDEKGVATLTIGDNSKIVKDSLDVITFEVEYSGDKLTESSKRKIGVKQANLDISFYQKDSIKYIEIEAVSINQNSNPIQDMDIEFYINGTFSLLKFEEQTTDDMGKVKVEFPIDMPGDTLGVLTIVAKIVEDKKYGTIESYGVINWGVPVPLIKEKKRGLGDTDAPLWMVYTLIILLSTVWFHYMYVIYLIVKIKLAR